MGVSSTSVIRPLDARHERTGEPRRTPRPPISRCVAHDGVRQLPRRPPFCTNCMSRSAITLAGRLIQRVHHQFGDEAPHGPDTHVLVGAVVADLDDQSAYGGAAAEPSSRCCMPGRAASRALDGPAVPFAAHRCPTTGPSRPAQAAQTSHRTHVELVAPGCARFPGTPKSPGRGSGPAAAVRPCRCRTRRVQFGLSQPLVGFPQLQSGPQVHGEQVQFRLAHSSSGHDVTGTGWSFAGGLRRDVRAPRRSARPAVTLRNEG